MIAVALHRSLIIRPALGNRDILAYMVSTMSFLGVGYSGRLKK
jgi:hypothetical protein